MNFINFNDIANCFLFKKKLSWKKCCFFFGNVLLFICFAYKKNCRLYSGDSIQRIIC